MRNQQKEGKEKEGNLLKPLPYFSFFRPFLSLLPTDIYIRINSSTFWCSSNTLFKANKKLKFVNCSIFLTCHPPFYRERQQETEKSILPNPFHALPETIRVIQ